MINEAVFIESGAWEGLWGTVEDERTDTNAILVRVTEDLAIWVGMEEVTLWDGDTNQTEGWDIARSIETGTVPLWA